MVSDLPYDVFLIHANPDKPAVEKLARRLKRRRLKPFLDRWHLIPGEPWQESLEEALDRSRTFAVFLGPGDLRPWQNEEMRKALDTRARDQSRRVIPVLLPGASISEKEALPPFLRRLTWVDFRSGFDDPQAIHRLVCGIKGIPPKDGPAPATPPSPSARPIMIGVPHPNSYFTGRELLLSRLHQQLQTQRISVIAQAAICGLGGIGKTQTAIEYAHRFGQHHRFILWVVAESETTVQTSYLSFARELGLVDSQANLETAVLAVKAWLAREDAWLLVFDNTDNLALVRAYLPSARMGGKVLLTSRAKSFAKVGITRPLRVETLAPDEAVQFLTKRTGSVDTEAAAELANVLGYLPLALEQAAAYIETVGGGFAEYLARYRRRGVALFARGEPTTDYPKTVATTWTLSFDAVRKASPASAELLTAAAFLVPDPVPIEIFTLSGSELGGLLAEALKGAAEDPLVFWELLEPLERHSLVERLPEDAFKIHRLTQEVIKDSLGEEGRGAWAERVIRALTAAYPRSEFATWKLCERLQPNARLASELVRTYELESIETARLFNNAGGFAGERGDHSGAKLFNELSLEIVMRELDGEHPATLEARSNLAETLRALGDLARAQKLQVQNLEIQERVLGTEHPDTLLGKNNLAETLRDLGDLAGAKRLQEQNLEVVESVLGDEHLYAFLAKSNLAVTFAALGDLGNAKQLQEQALGGFERVLGNEAPHTLRARNNLAQHLRSLGDLAGARKLQKQTLETLESVLGGEHPHVLIARDNLAGILSSLGDLAGARQLQEQTLKIFERLLGTDHPDTLISRNNLAETLKALGDLSGSKKLQEQTLEIQERTLGDTHANTLMSRHNLADTLSSLGDFSGARKLFEQTLEIQERILGHEHPHTLRSRGNLATTLSAMGDRAYGGKLQEQNLEILERILGGDHPETLAARNNLAEDLRGLGDLTGARKLQEQNLAVEERVFGTEHPSTTITIWNLLRTVRLLNDPAVEAELIDKLRWLLDSDEASIPSAAQRDIRQALLRLINSL